MGEASSRILFVDSDPAVGRTFRRTVGQLQFEIDIASSAEEALALSRRISYPIVVTDMHMPDIDGFELVELLTKHNPETTFILIASDPDLRLRSNGMVDGRIVSILSKPWDPEELVATLGRALDQHQRRTRPPRGADGVDDDSLQLLLVEDNPGDALLFMRQLPAEGAVVTHTTRLRDALTLLQARSFDVIVTDLSLPDARGLDAVMRIQQAAPDITVVVMTGLDDEALALQVVECGAQDCLLKGRWQAGTLVRSLRQARERKRCALRLTDLARTDPVTGLANRSGFDQRIGAALSRARRQAQRIAVMYLDLDGFKEVNDGYGHSTGDALLKLVGERLLSVVRGYDAVARLGGDEFALLIEDIGEDIDPVEFAERVISALAEPMVVDHVCHKVTASMGVALYPESGSTGEQLLQAADQAMYVAKRRGRNRSCVHVPEGRTSDSVPPTAH
jgi:diguanylate cyclase (GGDEF)-like protein